MGGIRRCERLGPTPTGAFVPGSDPTPGSVIGSRVPVAGPIVLDGRGLRAQRVPRNTHHTDGPAGPSSNLSVSPTIYCRAEHRTLDATHRPAAAVPEPSQSLEPLCASTTLSQLKHVPVRVAEPRRKTPRKLENLCGLEDHATTFQCREHRPAIVDLDRVHR